MQTFWLLFPSGLSALVLAAHFLRRGAWLPMAAAFALFALLWVRRTWAAHVVRFGLVLGAIEWWHTLATLSAERRALGEPWVRLGLILGAVIVVVILAIALLESAPVRMHFGRTPR